MNVPTTQEPLDPARFGPLESCLLRLAQLRREPLDALAVRDELDRIWDYHQGKKLIDKLMQQLNVYAPQWSSKPDSGRLPKLAMKISGRSSLPDWSLVTAEHPDGGWTVSFWDAEAKQFAEQIVKKFDGKFLFARLRFTEPFSLTKSATFTFVFNEILAEKGKILEMGAATLVVNVLAIATSLYAMQVYDRVVPTGATATLLALTIGISVSIMFETSGKWLRSTLINNLSDQVDRRLARTVYGRFLNIRLDQLPASVGSTASRMRGYESVRSIILAVTTNVLFDFPLAVLGLLVIYAIAGSLAVIVLGFFVLGIFTGTYFYRQALRWAQEATPAQHFKTGLVVESIEGAETIKSGQGGWRMLTRWLDISDEVRSLDRNIRDVSDHALFVVSMFQQLSYVLLIAFGALMVSSGDMTFGGLIACSILSGRIFTPVATLPKMMVQWGTTRAAVQDLDNMWKLEQDMPEGTKPVILDKVRGEFVVKDLKIAYGTTPVLKIKDLSIRAGEKVAVVGTIGAGKTTLLRVLSGMYKPLEGRVTLDGVDIGQIAKTSLSGHTGYVPQDGRLFAGSLRDNLLLGLTDPGDARILEVAQATGLMETVISPHPMGLERVIFEGGVGLSGGQRQLVHVTRAVLRNPTLWLLDEPTANMDQGLENRVLQAMRRAFHANSSATMILVTHKMQLVSLVERLIVLGREQVLFDGPRDDVLRQLNMLPQKPQKPSERVEGGDAKQISTGSG